jgi:hypothetical protein
MTSHRRADGRAPNERGTATERRLGPVPPLPFGGTGPGLAGPGRRARTEDGHGSAGRPHHVRDLGRRCQ